MLDPRCEQRQRLVLEPAADECRDLRLVAWIGMEHGQVQQANVQLGLGSEDRMNSPGTAEGNWSWRLRRGQLTDELAARLRESTEASKRLPG